MTKVLAERMEKVIDGLIHCNQTGFLKDRYIGDCIRFVEDLIENTNENKRIGAVMFLDFEKAFDSIE